MRPLLSHAPTTHSIRPPGSLVGGTFRTPRISPTSQAASRAPGAAASRAAAAAATAAAPLPAAAAWAALLSSAWRRDSLLW